MSVVEREPTALELESIDKEVYSFLKRNKKPQYISYIVVGLNISPKTVKASLVRLLEQDKVLPEADSTRTNLPPSCLPWRIVK